MNEDPSVPHTYKLLLSYAIKEKQDELNAFIMPRRRNSI